MGFIKTIGRILSGKGRDVVEREEERGEERREKVALLGEGGEEERWEVEGSPWGGVVDNPQIQKSVSVGSSLPVADIGKPVWTNWSAERAISHGMKASVWVYACINAISSAAASVPLRVQRRGRGGEWEWEESGTGGLAGLLARPNDFWTQADLLERSFQHLLLSGNAIETKIRSGERVVELWTISPDLIKPVPDPVDYIAYYQYQQGIERKRLEVEDVIHVQLTDPSNPYWGLSPLQAAAKTVDTEVESVNWNRMSLRNRAVADGVITYKQDLSKRQWAEARKRIRIQHQGSANARMPWVLGNEATWTPMSLSPVEMDFLEGRKMGRMEICAIYRVPPPVVGIQEQTTYNNYRTAWRVFWRDNIKPFVEKFASSLTDGLAGDFGGDRRVWPDFSGVDALSSIPETTQGTVSAFFAIGVPFSALNERFGLGFERFGGDDVSYVGGVPASVGSVSTGGESERMERGGGERGEEEGAGALELALSMLQMRRIREEGMGGEEEEEEGLSNGQAQA